MPLSDQFVPDSNLVKQLETLLKEHRGLAAWEEIKNLPDLRQWRGFEGRLVASKLASALGDGRLGSVLDWLNWKEHPENHRAYFRALFPRFWVKGAALLIPEMEERLGLVEPGTEIYSDFLGLIAACYVNVLEFEKAHQLLDDAMKDCQDPSWLWVQRSLAYRREDRYEEALASIEEGKKLKPYYRPVVEVHADALIHLGRDEEAQALLEEASRHSDSSAFPLKLSVIHSERDEVERTAHWLDEYERRSPILSKASRQWLAGRRADQCYLSGDIDGFLSLSEGTKEKSFHWKCRKYYLENDGGNGTRKRLDVTFVRQHSMTCAPATMAALTRFFGQDHDHLEIAKAICYDGTPWHKERQWCEENGFYVREFLITMSSAKVLIDAGIPFSLSTQSIDSGHLQACIGYDEKLGLLLLRDPTLRHYGESILSSLEEQHPVYGLRGLVFVPEGQKGQLEELDLPLTAEYDFFHDLLVAFEEFNFPEARKILDRFGSECPGSVLRLQAECLYASYCNHPVVELEFTEKLLERFPKHQKLWLRKIRILETLSRHTEARDLLASIHRKPEKDPFFDIEVGQTLCRDVRTIELGRFYLRRALRQQSSSAQAHASYASCLTTMGEREEALRFRRAASRLSRSFEPYALRYYREAKYLRKEAMAMEFLLERARRVGDQEVAPHLTLLEVMSDNSDPGTPEFAGDLLKRFPDDGELLLKTVTLFSGWNRHEEARVHLERSEGKVAPEDWLRVAARFWSWTGDRKKSRGFWQKLIEVEPLNVTAYESVARHLAEEEGRDEAVAFLRGAYEAHPNYLPLLKSYIEWVEFEGPAVSIPLLEKAVALDPDDLWAIRELALELGRAARHEEAEEKAREALAYDPRDDVSHGILGLVLEGAQKIEASISAFREALKLDIDYLSAFNGLMRVSQTFAERRESLRFVREEMVKQVSNGDIVQEYRVEAMGVVEDKELEADLRLFHQERPDLWQTFGALREHYHATLQHDLELKIAEELTQSFPLLPRAWVELAFALRAQGRTEEEVAAFQSALELSPSWDWILRELSLSLESLNRFDEALAALDRAIDADPLAPGGYGYQADLLWKTDRKLEAVEVIKKGLKMSPLYQWGWSKLIVWTKRLGREAEVQDLLEELEKSRSHQWRWWSCIADVYSDLEDHERALAALERGLELAPTELTLIDMKASQLALLGRYSEALVTCKLAGDGESQPVRLRGREAWILMESGRRKDAWDLMQALSESEPDYYFAHNHLARWAYKAESWNQLRLASKRMVALRPDESESWGYLGHAEEELKNPGAAYEAYSRALRADPAYLFGARRKAFLEIQEGKLDEAETTLNRISYHDPSSFVILDQLAIAVKRCHGKLNEEVRDCWERLSIRGAELDEDPFYFADPFFTGAALRGVYETLLSERAKAGGIRSKAEARAWGRRVREAKKRKRLIRETLESALIEEFQASVIASVIRGSGSDVPLREVRKLIKAREALVLKYHDSWVAALRFFGDDGKGVEVCRYGAMWREFLPDVKPGNLVIYPGYVDEIESLDRGLEVRRDILSEFPQWEGTRFLRLGVAFHEALAGKLESAGQLIAGYEDGSRPASYYDAIYQQTLAVMAAHRGDAGSCEQHFRNAALKASRYAEDVAALRYLRASAEVCVERLNIFKGKPTRLLKKWAQGLGVKKSIFRLVVDFCRA